MPSFIALGTYFIFETNLCYLAVILISFGGYLVVTSRYLVVTGCYLVATGGYCSLLVLAARYRFLLVVPIFSMNEDMRCFRRVLGEIIPTLLQSMKQKQL